MLNGRLYDADTLDEVYPRQLPPAPLWWWDDEPESVPGIAPQVANVVEHDCPTGSGAL